MTLSDRLAPEAGRLRLGDGSSVNRLGFGTMQLPGPGSFGPPDDHAAALTVLRRAVELGVNYLDTSDFYGPHVANDLIREALHPYPDDLVIGTKIGVVRDNWGDFVPAGAPDQLRRQVQENLRRLGRDRLELVYLRVGGDGLLRPGGTRFSESFAMLVRLREEGLVGDVGLSGVTLKQLDQARATIPIAAVQNRFHLLDRDCLDVLHRCTEEQIAFVPYFPLGAGLLSGRTGRPQLPFGPDFSATQRRTVDRIADGHDATRAQIAIAWLLAYSPAILVIPGTSSVRHLEENMAAARMRLTPADRAALDALA
ncbi:aldo/keto reductase [Micromonospora sp. NPDC049081]|uniref:aldo/keto reductase n=1 Tax=Micromonospora sp. NPDC049081 TaxID=3155150 RepID=UPI0033D155FE